MRAIGHVLMCVLSQVDAVKDILSQLPSENLALIRVIVELLKQVSSLTMLCVYLCMCCTAISICITVCVCACVCMRACVCVCMYVVVSEVRYV